MNSNYNLDIETIIEEFKRDGFAYLPSIKSHVDALGIVEDVYSQMASQTYSEGLEVQKRLLNYLGVRDLIMALFKVFTDDGFNLKKSDEYLITRHVKEGQSSEAFRSHFDGHLITLVLPIKIPNDRSKPCGELKFVANARKQPRSEIENFFQKLLWKRYATADGMSKVSENRRVRTEFFTDGRPLLFRGTTTFHGNNYLANGQGDRISMLCHYFDPSPPYGISNLLRKARGR